MVKNIVFDIGNVVLEFKPHKYFTKHFANDDASEKICKMMMSSQIWKNYDLGIYNLEDVKNAFKKEMPLYQTQIDQMLSMWVKILEPIDYTLEKMQMLKKQGYGIYLLSNLNKEAFEYIKKRYFIFDFADGYIVSFQEQLAKPDKAIYELLCNRYQLLPQECVFIDDLKENVEAAIHYQMHGIHFIDEKQVNEQLEQLLMEKTC
ncbi:MAG: HAD family phosphatase [Erysipelotrichia bacterium]|nr:HAD family phosphatase [Erysipelotrichia bacterium]NCC53978.1 HAD family phosphatase [Erysipelotrichia bacterium]